MLVGKIDEVVEEMQQECGVWLGEVCEDDCLKCDPQEVAKRWLKKGWDETLETGKHASFVLGALGAILAKVREMEANQEHLEHAYGRDMEIMHRHGG